MFPMETMVSIQISFVRLFGRGKATKIKEAVMPNLGNPRIKGGLGVHHAFKSRCIVRKHALVREIFGFCNVAKIADAIIRRTAIDMINLTIRPFTVHDEPYHSMGLIYPIENFDGAIGPMARCAGRRANFSSPTPSSPKKKSRVREIFKLSSRFFGCEHDHLKPHKQKQERTGDNAERGDADEKNSGADREYIERRLRDIAAFEKRAKGIIPHRLRRERK